VLRTAEHRIFIKPVGKMFYQNAEKNFSQKELEKSEGRPQVAMQH